MQHIPMTAQGVKKLQEELIRLKSTERPRIIQAIADARAYGDLKENSEYHAARESQSLMEGRIAELESKLGVIRVIDVTQIENTGRVIFGTTVQLRKAGTTLVTLQIVGEDEADISNNKISVTSPVARALVGKYEGEEVDVMTPEGTVTYEIIKVEHV
ncbi:MAG: transcription elongation factor GreA [Gammaproteobacteria bacterium RIFCSPHIGHO2_12_FULL_42_10]|nr:MAG: transcription elongation factor GreA [Gammaproteobacteria bacterium RIFCSPHIGHO2_12_FULL_42_10]